MAWLGEHPVSLVTVYLGFYLAIVFLSLSIGEGGGCDIQNLLPG